MAIIALIVSLIVCWMAVKGMRANSQKAEKWTKTGIDVGANMDDKDVMFLLSNLKLPEEKTVKINEEREIVIEVNKTAYKVEKSENQEGNTIIKFMPANANEKNVFSAIELTWLYEFLSDEVLKTSTAQKYYKETNGNARRLLFGGIAAIICVIVIIANNTDRLEKEIKKTAPNMYPDITYEEAFEGYFPGYFLNRPSWLLIEDEYGFTTLTFRGCIPTAAIEAVGCEEIYITLDVIEDDILLKDVIIYGDLEDIIIPFERKLSPLLDEYVIEFLFEHARGLSIEQPKDPLSYAFIKMVQNSSFSNYPSSLIGETFSRVFVDKCEWTYFLSDLGKDIVEFNGQINEETYRMQFLINENCEEFTLDYMEVNGQALSEFEEQIYLSVIFLAN